MLEDYISKLSKDLELQNPLANDGDGGYSLLFDDTPITIRSFDGGFQLYATFGELTSTLPELFMAKMLRGNLFGQATSDAYLGLDESGSKMTLSLASPQKMSYKYFRERLEDFMNTIDFWKAEVKLHESAPNQA